VDLSRYNPAINTIYFPNTLASYYWSSTTLAHSTSYAWPMYFYGGSTYWNSKSHDGYVRAVRGGQGGLFGDLTVSIELTEARSAGAKWRVDGGAWHESGDTQYSLTTGEHMLEFKTISGWSRPGNQQITIVEGQIIEAAGTYTEDKAVTWLGHTTDWDSITNWSTGIIPDLSTTVTIPNAPSGGYFPVIDKQAVAHSVTIKDGNIIIQSGGELTLGE